MNYWTFSFVSDSFVQVYKIKILFFKKCFKICCSSISSNVETDKSFLFLLQLLSGYQYVKHKTVQMGFKIKIKKPKFPLFTESFQQRQFLQFMQFTNAIVKLFLESLAAAFKALSEMLIFICLFICIYIFNYVICCYAIYFELPSVLEKYFCLCATAHYLL